MAAEFDWAQAQSLPGFLAGITPLTEDERRAIIDAAASLLGGYYVHLPDKRKSLGIDPLAALAALRETSPRFLGMSGEIAFHTAMCTIFASLRDLHTQYSLPERYQSKACLLPFKFAACGDASAPHFIVTDLQASYLVPPDQAGFDIGAELLTWNDQPIADAVAAAAQRSGGASPAARQARAVMAMTIQPMQRQPPPASPVIRLTYRRADGTRNGEAIFPWRVIDVALETTDPSLAAFVGLDHEGEARRHASTHAYRPTVLEAAERARAGGLHTPYPETPALPTCYPSVFKAHPLPGTEFGYLRIFSFAPPSAGQTIDQLVSAFTDEFVRLHRALPPAGLVLDVRGNGGGFLPLAEALLQTLTERTITPEPVEIRATPQTLDLCRNAADLQVHLPSVQRALPAGGYSDGVAMTETRWCNGRARSYRGPVVLIIDARCYSATDAFAAGFQDHEIGKLLGVAPATGAGGANVWQLAQFLDVPGETLPRLPQGASLRVALRRTRRVGRNAGQLVEGAGVVADVTHTVTRADLLDGDADLIAKATQMFIKPT